MTEPISDPAADSEQSSDEYVSLRSRYAAYLADFAPVGLVWIAVGLASSPVPFDPRDQIADGVFWIRVFWVVIFGSAVFVLWNLYRQGKTGSSIGKAFLGFRVVSEDSGEPIGFVRTVVRFLLHVIDVAPLPIGFLVALFNPKRQMIADLIMKTVCVSTEKDPYSGTAS